VSPNQPQNNVTTGAYRIIFDGGALGNPGKGYGSYQITGPEGVLAHDKLDYPGLVTNNQAEYRTLIGALERLQAHLGTTATSVAVTVNGDSQLVVNQVNGAWKVRHPDLQPLHARAVVLLRGFSRASVVWHRRAASVKVLGH